MGCALLKNFSIATAPFFADACPIAVTRLPQGLPKALLIVGKLPFFPFVY